ncbi:alpha/beta fold hydrolase [Candidatus Woesearchaeota archaeon]|nr:alpha/beta fold hydrolase [Candidatus Woesearchaeota archaeon]
MKTENIELVNSAGLTIRGTLWMPKPGKHPTVVIFHGLTGGYTLAWYQHIIKAFTHADFIVAGFDFTNGTATSDGNIKDLTLDQEVEDAKIIIDFLKKHPSVGPIGVFGHSLGGVVGCIISAQDSTIASLVLSATVWDPAKELPPLFNTTPQIWERTGAIPFPQEWSVPAKLKFQFYRSLTTYNALATAKNIKQPTLVLHGDADDVVSVENAKNYYDALPARKKLLIIPRGKHSYVNNTLTLAINASIEWFRQTL